MGPDIFTWSCPYCWCPAKGFQHNMDCAKITLTCGECFGQYTLWRDQLMKRQVGKESPDRTGRGKPSGVFWRGTVDQRKGQRREGANPIIDFSYRPTASDPLYGVDQGRAGRRMENRICGQVFNKRCMRIYRGISERKYYEDMRKVDRRTEDRRK